MADRYAFQSPFSRGSGSTPWFTIGSVGVTTTVAISGMSIIGLFVLAIEQNSGPIGSALVLTDDAIFGGQLWRLFTWPIAIISSRQLFGQFLSAIFFFSIGTQMEMRLGRRAYTWMIGLITVVPAVLGSLVAAISNFGVFETGLSVLFLGVAVGFAASMPHARSFFNIPFWVLVAVIFGITILGDLADGNMPALVMHLTAGALGLVVVKSLGYAPEVEWAPSIPLPASMTSEGSTPSVSSKRTKRPKKAKKSKGSTHLRSVPSSTASEAEIDSLLDQVNEQGLDSLTKQQKATLERHAKEMRKRRDL
jgi:hypothetical protein